MDIKPDEKSVVYDAYMQNMKLMNAVIAEMKEVPVLPSEVVKETSALLKVEFPEDGGVLTYMEGHDHPYKGFPYFEFVEKIDVMKKIVRATLSGAYYELKKCNKLWLITLIPAMWVLKPIVRIVVYTFYRMIERFRVKTLRLSQSMRELHRSFSVEIDNERPDDREFRQRFRDLICQTAEFDNAYRYRIQDIMVELDKEGLNQNPVKEILRLFELLMSREKTQEVKDTWTLLKFFIRYYIRFDKKLQKIIVSALSNINFDEIKLQVEDRHYCKPRKDYNFGFMEKSKNNE